MNNRFNEKKAYRTFLSLAIGVYAALLAASPSQAAALWSNGAVNGSLLPANRCDDGPNLCGNAGGNSWTVFDNFNVASGKTWNVTSVDFVDFLTNGLTSDIGQTTVSIWRGDPFAGGTLVASATAAPSLTNLAGTCGNGNTCLELFALNLSTTLSGGSTYYLGATVHLTATNPGENTERAFAAGGNTAAGGTANSTVNWELSNGSISGSTWVQGPSSFNFPGMLGVTETATAFDINGTVAAPAPEPGGLTIVGLALAGFCLFRRRFLPRRG